MPQIARPATPLALSVPHILRHGRQDKTRPLLGGIAIQSKSKDGTLGLCFTSRTGGKRLLTAAHVISDGIGGTIGQAAYADTIGAVIDTAPDFQNVAVDAAMVNVSVDIDVDTVLGTVIPYTIDSYRDWTEANDKVQIEGAVSGTSQGSVVYPNVDLTTPEFDKTYAAIATYVSAPGDSGAPVVFFDADDKACLVGLHGGKVKIDGSWYSWFVPLGTFSDWAFPDGC